MPDTPYHHRRLSDYPSLPSFPSTSLPLPSKKYLVPRHSKVLDLSSSLPRDVPYGIGLSWSGEAITTIQSDLTFDGLLKSLCAKGPPEHASYIIDNLLHNCIRHVVVLSYPADVHPYQPSTMSSSEEPWSAENAAEQIVAAVIDAARWSKTTSLWLFGKTPRRVRAVGGVLLFTILALLLWRPDQRYEVPQVSFDYGGKSGQSNSPYNVTKVALLIENRPNPILVPLMLHFMSVVPPDWRFRFMGSIESVAHVNQSYAIRNQVAIGKLDLTYIPMNMSVIGQEMISRFLTNLWLYEQLLAPAEHLLVYQTDSMLCANSRQTLNDYLDYDWVGAPWSGDSRYGGNGGLSLRRVSAIVEVLRNQERLPDTDPEDKWLTERVGNRPGAKTANGSVSLAFSGENLSGEIEHVEHNKGKGKKLGKLPADKGIDSRPQDEGWTEGIDDFRDGFYEPMGYHTGGGGSHVAGGIYGTPEMRKHIWDYCPELKMTLDMDAAEYVIGDCNQNWKRDVEYGGMAKASPRGVELDENGYPPLPPGLVPW